MLRKIQEVGLKIWILFPVALALLSSAIFFIVVIYRLQYPFELEWIEGAYLDQARWLASGNELFTLPVIEFIPTNKTPLFFIIASVFVRWFGEGFFAVRLLSNLAVLGTVFLLWNLNYKRTKIVSAALVSVGLYLASYYFTGSWMDLGKTDSLLLFFILLGFYWHLHSEKFHWFLVALAYVLAYFTKQLALPILITMAGVSLITTRFSTWKLWLFTGIFGLSIFFIWDYITHGWFSFYTFDTTIHHSINSVVLWQFWTKVLPKWWPSLIILGMYTGFTLWKVKKKEITFQSFAATMGLWLGLLAGSWSVFFKVWTYDNALMPISLGSALVGGLAYGEFANWYRQEPEKKQAMHWSAVVFFLVAQFFLWRYNPVQQIPTRQDFSTGKEFVAHLASIQGDVWLYNHGFITALADKHTFLHSSPLGDVAGVSSPDDLSEDTAKRRNHTLRIVDDAVKDQRFSWIFVDNNPENWLPYYLEVERFFAGNESFYPVTGASTRPEYGLIRNPVVYGGQYPLDSLHLDAFFSSEWDLSDGGVSRILGSQGEISIALLAGESYTFDFRMASQCVGDIPVVGRFAWYWNDILLFNVPVTDCAEIEIPAIPLPIDEISGNLDSLKVIVERRDEWDDNYSWSLEVRELNFHMIGNTNLP